ncbi:hypothetical protein AcV7_008573 [Taiwanofungus camphoratus]|nr:hypothetical protein AcV7_008573 [Antrodia cinnamomea]
MMVPEFKFKINTPAPVSYLVFASSQDIFAGSDDGTLRLYRLPSPKVARAIKSLGPEVSSVACSKLKNDEVGDFWVASGRRALLFEANVAKLILSAEDAAAILDLGQDDEDVLNELCLSDNRKHMAFSTDSGSIGIVDLSTRQVSRMKTSHNSICGTVRFIPDRPGELVSGGYDSALLHFDLNQGTLLSRYDITAPPPTSGVSLSPPFVLASSMTSTGLFAASTADGRVWLAGGGEKRTPNVSGSKKRSRKWEGLKEDEAMYIQVAEGPVVAVSFSGTGSVVTCSLLGSIAGYTIFRDNDGRLQTNEAWSIEATNIAKVNTLAVSEHWLTVGGIGQDSKGVIEVWSLDRVAKK